MSEDREQECQRENGEDQQVVTHAFAAEGSEKAGAAAQADCVDKDDQAEVVDDVGQLEVGMERADRKSREKNRRDAKTASADLDAPERIANRDDGE